MQRKLMGKGFAKALLLVSTVMWMSDCNPSTASLSCEDQCASALNECESCCMLATGDTQTQCLNRCTCDHTCCQEECAGITVGQCNQCRRLHLSHLLGAPHYR